jgi:hypothetical protein
MVRKKDKIFLVFFLVLLILIFFINKNTQDIKTNQLSEDEIAMMAFATGNISYCDLNENKSSGFTHFYPDRCRAFFYFYNVLKNADNCDDLRNRGLITANFLQFCQVIVERNRTVCDIISDAPDDNYLHIDCLALYYDDPSICDNISENTEWILDFSRRDYCRETYWSMKAIREKNLAFCDYVKRDSPRKICHVVVTEDQKTIFENE